MAANPFFIESFRGYVPKLNQDFASYTGPGNIQNTGDVEGPSALQGVLAEYIDIFSFRMSYAIINALGGGADGCSLLMLSHDNNASGYFAHSMPGSYGRIRFGFSVMTNLGASVGIELVDSGVAIQCSVSVDTSGRVVFKRGAINGGVALFTSAALFLSNIRHYIVCDVTIHSTTGTIDIWLDGNSIASLTGQDTAAGAANSASEWRYYLKGPTNSKGGFGDFWIQDNTDGLATITGDRIVDGLLIESDNAVQFSPALSLVGNFHAMLTAGTNAPGANQLVLVPVTPLTNRTINNINIMPRATSSTAKFTGVIYSDSAGSPGSLLSSGTEAVGCTSGTALSLGLTTPQALTAGTQYWIGYITDTALAIQVSDPYQNIGQRAANTYTSGAPASAPAMTTGQSTWAIWGLATGAGVNYDQVNRLPPAMQSSLPVAYNQSGTVGQVDSFNVEDLPVTPTGIDIVQIKVLGMRTDAGARTVNIRAKSGATAGNGDNAGITPPTSLQWLSSRFAVNPATSAAWTPAEVNGMLAEYEVAS